jgi:hypothetical protein
MGRLETFREILALYRRHGWRLVRALLTKEALVELGGGSATGETLFEGAPVYEAEVDAMWFARAAQGGREAWELRLVGPTPYALFEPDELEEDREDVRREMEARLREHAAPRA